MTTYTLTVSTDDLGLGVIDGARVIAVRRRAIAADQYPPIDALYRIETAANSLGVATISLKSDDTSTYHAVSVIDTDGVVVHDEQIMMPPSACDLHDVPAPPTGTASIIQFKVAGVDKGTPTTTRNVNITGNAVASSDFSTDTLTITLTKPTTPAEVGADAAGTAASAVSAHSSASDPHGDRAYSDYRGIDVRAHGGISGGTSSANATALSAAVTAAIANGSRRVYIPFDSWTVTTGTDAQNCIIAGNGATALTGVIGAYRYDGCVINGSRQDYMANHPAIPFDTVMKLVKVHDANTVRILVQKPTKGYAYLTLKNNSTTAGSDSLATTTADATMWRVTAAQDAVECLCGITTKSGKSNVSGDDTDFDDVTLTTDVPTYTSGTAYNYSRSTEIGAWAEYTVTVPTDGYLAITFLESASASDDVTVSIDTVAIDSNFTTVSATTRRVTRVYSVKPGSRVVKIANNTAGSTGLNIVGLYFSALKNARNDIAYDSYGVYRNSANIDPVIQSSANDLVLKDYDSAVSGTPGIYGGSYHGGESGISSTLYVNGVAATISSGNLFVGSSVEMQQNCTITWSGVKAPCTYSGASVAVHTRTIAIIGGHAQCATVTGALTAREIYPTLVGVNEDYTAITAPQYKQLDMITNNAFFPLGQNNSVEYHYAATGQRLRITHSLLSCPDSANGGAYIWRVVGSYCKYYNPWVWRGKRDVTSITSINIIQAS